MNQRQWLAMSKKARTLLNNPRRFKVTQERAKAGDRASAYLLLVAAYLQKQTAELPHADIVAQMHARMRRRKTMWEMLWGEKDSKVLLDPRFAEVLVLVRRTAAITNLDEAPGVSAQDVEDARAILKAIAMPTTNNDKGESTMADEPKKKKVVTKKGPGKVRQQLNKGTRIVFTVVYVLIVFWIIGPVAVKHGPAALPLLAFFGVTYLITLPSRLRDFLLKHLFGVVGSVGNSNDKGNGDKKEED